MTAVAETGTVFLHPETGERITVVDRLRQFNPTALGKALELIGRNKSVGAFRETIEVSHVGYLGEQLNKRGKQLEEAATRRMLKLVE